jgi:transcriptional regulator with XRE-family HTH domain
MEDIKKIIAKNLIALRKKHNLTQNELAEKLNYSDNAISRWEHGEVTPSIETLQQISEIYRVPIHTIIEDNALHQAEMADKRGLINKLAVILISSSLVWLLATIIFVTAQMVWNYTFWQIFVWSMPIIALVMLPFYHYWGGHIYKFTIISIFMWTLILSIFLQFYHLTPWLWMIFTIGVPIQIALSIWAFVKPKPAKQKKVKKSKEEKSDIKNEKKLLKEKYKEEKKKLKKEKESK